MLPPTHSEGDDDDSSAPGQDPRRARPRRPAARGARHRRILAGGRDDRRAADLGLEPVSAPVTQFNLAIDALDIAAIRPFWTAVLGFRDAAESQPIDLVDPDGRLPGVWFQQMDEARPQRNRIHLDVLVPHDVVHERLQAALFLLVHRAVDALQPERILLLPDSVEDFYSADYRDLVTLA